MRKLVLLAALLLSQEVFAQTTVKQSGSITPGHAVKWTSTGVVSDAGTATAGSLTSLGITNNSGPALCINSAAVTGPYNQLCLAVTTNGGAKLSSYIFGGATTPGLTIDINGTTQGFLTVSGAVATNDFACFADTTGNVKSCGQGSPIVTNHAVAIGTGVAGFSSANTSSTAGVPFLSTGSSTDPAFSAGGLDLNILNAQTTAYSLQTTDCGKTVTLGGAAFYTFTVGAASGFGATCSVTVINIDTTRWKAMSISGVTFPNGNYLMAGQSFTLKNESNAWKIVQPPGRMPVTASLTFYVNTSAADDSSDCLAAGSSTAQGCKTLATVVSRVCTFLDIGAQVTIQLTTGQTQASQSLCNYVGNVQPSTNNPVIQGDTSSCANAGNFTIDGVATTTIIPVGIYTPWTIQGVKLANSSNGTSVEADARSHLYLGTNVVFPTVTGFHVRSFYQSFVEFIGNYCITGGAGVHANSQSGGQILIQPSLTVTISNTPAFSSFFAQSTTNGLQIWTGTTFSGSATGTRYSATTGGGIDTNGGGATFLPGNGAGSVSAPGWYN